MIGRLSGIAGGVGKLVAASWQGGLLGEDLTQGGWFGSLAGLLFAAVILAALVVVARKLGNPKRWNFATLNAPALALLASGAWLAFATYVPFMLAGQPPDGDSLRGVAIALAFLVAIVFVEAQNWRQRVWFEVGVSVFCIFWLISGATGYASALNDTIHELDRVNNYILSLKHLVPAIKEDAVTINVNAVFSRSGCAGLQNMIFNRRTIRCVILKQGDKEENYIRSDGWILEANSSGRYELDNIILTFDATGWVTLIPELGPDDLPGIPLTWEVREPLRTVYDIIYPENYESGLHSRLYEYALRYAAMRPETEVIKP